MANTYIKMPKLYQLKQSQMTKKKLTSIILAIFVIQAAIFTYFYLANRDPGKVIGNVAGVTQAPVPIFGIYGDSSMGNLKKPMAVTTYGRKIFVSDTDNQRIAVFDYDGKPLYSFGKDGTGQGEFKFPYGITVDNSGKVYVADLITGKISVFDQSGKFIKYFADDQKIFQKPAGLFFFDNQIFVTDVQQHQVTAFTLDGQKTLELGKKGNGDGELSSPNAVTVTKDFIYVSDTGNDRVEKFNRSGQFIATITGSDSLTQGSGFVNVRGVAVDGKGTLYVVSNLTNKLWGIDKSGKPAFDPVGELGDENNQFGQPNGMYIDDQGRIYIADSLNQRIMVYQN